ETVGEDPQAEADLAQLLAVAAAPAGVVLPVQERLGVGHQAEHPAAAVAEARGALGRAAGVGWPGLGDLAGLVDVADGDPVFGRDGGRDRVVGEDQLALAMAARAGDLVEASGPQARALGVAAHPHPGVAVPEPIVADDRDLL